MNMQTSIMTRSKGVCVQMLAVAAFSVAMALSAHVRIPLFFTPIPFTLQTFVLALSVGALKRKAIGAQFLYIMLGVLGVPVFSAGASLGALVSPSGGYIFGFCVFALIVPYLWERMKPSAWFFLQTVSLYMGAMLVCVYGCGIIWMHYAYGVGWGQTFTLGVLPFILGDLLKMVAAGALIAKNR